MENFLKRCWANISIDNLQNNINIIKKHINKNTKIMAAVKANAYGHGDKVIAKYLEEFGVSWFAVSNIEEALALRSYGTKLPILILGATPASYAKILYENNITQSVFSKEYANELSKEAQKANVCVNAHIKIDTGMGRIGFSANINDIDKTINDLTNIYTDNNINCTGIFTHFSCADADYEYTKIQFERFIGICNKLNDIGIKIKYRHCSNSAAIALYPQFHLDAVRPGIILYGYHPSDLTKNEIDIKPVLSVKSRVTHVKNLPKDSYVSYANTYKTNETQKIATIPIGYADGFLRGNFSKANIIYKGKLLPVVGRICMDQCMINATGVNNIDVGDVVTVLGSDGGVKITADDLADNLQTISYEILCLLSKRLPRIYVNDEKIRNNLHRFYKLLLT